eukprot:TRINITY_DN30001_c0_g1_i1.p1 TRINITY_DN30001_c0_g1~~TRINITY_DN30001_c0_g1_i1.p1  ORF type:complete len:184 (-),score=38.26 TRINITY_DN30001_c0_g1_i1:194-697(-)
MSKFPVISKEKAKLKLKELQSQLLKPLTKENIFYHYLPIMGVKSYMELSFSVMNPSLSTEIYRRLGFPSDLTTANTMTAASCLGLYLYNRQTMAGKPLHIRGAYCIYHSSIFVLGSILGWAILARSMPSSSVFRTMIALGSSAAMLKFSKDSLDHIDSRLGNTLGKM